jgi:hypothetical protein
MKHLCRTAIACLALVTVLPPLFAQDSDNIEYFGDMVNVRFFTGSTSLQADITTSKTPKEGISYSPNPGAGGYYGVGIYWNGLGISFVDDIPDLQSDENLYGKSEFENFTMFYYARQWSFDLFYQRFQGFYISNPEKFGMREGDPETIRPDLTLTSLGINAYYQFSGDYSLIAAFNQTERQLRSGGSFLLMATVMRFTVESDGPLVPSAYDDGEYAGFRGGWFYSLGLCPGYAYTVVFENFYLTIGGFLGGGLIYQRIDIASGDKTGFNPMLKTNVKSALGYNGDRVFAGIIFIYDIISGGFGDLYVDQGIFNLEMFAGMRF